MRFNRYLSRHALPRCSAYQKVTPWLTECRIPRIDSATRRLRDGTMKAAPDPMGRKRGQCDAKFCRMSRR